MSIAASIDTNVLVRLLVRDDAQQSAAVQKLLAQYGKRLQALFVPITVTLELEWVLRSRYQLGKADFVCTLNALLATVELVFEAEHALEPSLVSNEDGNADFPDCLHLALGRTTEALPFLTFDAKASKSEGAKLLK